MSNNTPTGISMLKAQGKYTVVNDSVVKETNEISQTGKAEKTDCIRVEFIGKELMNTYHNINSKEGIWEELWKRVSTNADDSDMEYLNTEKDNYKVSRDLDGILSIPTKPKKKVLKALLSFASWLTKKANRKTWKSCALPTPFSTKKQRELSVNLLSLRECTTAKR